MSQYLNPTHVGSHHLVSELRSDPFKNSAVFFSQYQPPQTQSIYPLSSDSIHYQGHNFRSDFRSNFNSNEAAISFEALAGNVRFDPWKLPYPQQNVDDVKREIKVLLQQAITTVEKLQEDLTKVESLQLLKTESLNSFWRSLVKCISTQSQSSILNSVVVPQIPNLLISDAALVDSASDREDTRIIANERPSEKPKAAAALVAKQFSTPAMKADPTTEPAATKEAMPLMKTPAKQVAPVKKVAGKVKSIEFYKTHIFKRLEQVFLDIAFRYFKFDIIDCAETVVGKDVYKLFVIILEKNEKKVLQNMIFIFDPGGRGYLKAILYIQSSVLREPRSYVIGGEYKLPEIKTGAASYFDFLHPIQAQNDILDCWVMLLPFQMTFQNKLTLILKLILGLPEKQCVGLFFDHELFQTFNLLRFHDYKTASQHVDILDDAMKAYLQRVQIIKELKQEFNYVICGDFLAQELFEDMLDLYLSIGSSLIESLGALFDGVLLINLVIALFALVAIKSSSQSLGRTLAFIIPITGFSMRSLSSFLWIQMNIMGPTFDNSNFEDGLYQNDKRYICYASVPPIYDIGTDALLEPMKTMQFAEALSEMKIAIKTLLLDQSMISGSRNWVVDKVLFHAMILSMQTASSLLKESCEALHKSIKEDFTKTIRFTQQNNGEPCLSYTLEAICNQFSNNDISHSAWNDVVCKMGLHCSTICSSLVALSLCTILGARSLSRGREC